MLPLRRCTVGSLDWKQVYFPPRRIRKSNSHDARWTGGQWAERSSDVDRGQAGNLRCRLKEVGVTGAANGSRDSVSVSGAGESEFCLANRVLMSLNDP